MKRILTTALVAALLPLSALAGNYTFTANTGFFTTSTGLSHGAAGTWGLSNSNGVNNTTGSTTTAYTNLWNDINTSGLIVQSATLTLSGIYDWTGETNDPCDALWVNILSGINAGVSAQKVFDSVAVGDTTDSTWPAQVSPFTDVPSTSGDWNDALQAAGLVFTDAESGSLLKVTTYGTGANDTKVGTPSSVTWSDPTGAVASNLVITFNTANLALLRSLLDFDMYSTSNPTVGLGFAAECHYYMNSASLNIVTAVPDAGSTVTLMGLGLVALVGFRRSRK
jgi:hypothetical protein